MKTAMWWERKGDGRVQCRLCPHLCVIAEGKAGRCRVRGVRGGELKALSYGCISSAGVDPIEKKPLYHFQPGANIFSIGGWGCNFACDFCQNWTISQQFNVESRAHTASAVVPQALAGDSIGMAYTYNEPLVGYEFVLECSRLMREKGGANVLVTNGFILPEPATELLPLIDALNIDVKSMEESFYREHCRGTLAPVQAFAEQAARAGCHVEITNLVIPGLNDSLKLVERLAVWVATALGPDTPLHLSAYHPQYKMKTSATSAALLEEAHATAHKHLHHVFLGNVWSRAGSDTLCTGCNHVLIERRGYRTRVTGLEDGCCRECGTRLAYVAAR